MNTDYVATNIDEYLESTETMQVECPKEYYAANPQGATKGIILYQGAKVDNLAYAPLAYKIAEEGYFCAVVDAPANFVFNEHDTVELIKKNYPQITEWYIGGHSLGGSMAAREVRNYPDDYAGLILLAAFSDVDISDCNIRVVSIYGSNDKILTKSLYNSCKKNLPNIVQYVIGGGNHANFGSYGIQSRDGDATITGDEQQELTVKALCEFLK